MLSIWFIYIRVLLARNVILASMNFANHKYHWIYIYKDMSVFCVRLNEVRVCLWFIWIYIESTYVYEWEVFTWYMYIYYILWVLFWIMEVYAVRRVHQTPETHALTRFIEQRFRLQSVFYVRQLKSRAEHTTQHNNPENHPPHTLYTYVVR